MFKEHILIIDEILKLLAKSRLQVSNKKSRFCQEFLKYLAFQLNRTEYKPLPLQVSAILRINPPENINHIHSFLGMINFIKNHIPRHAKICKPITCLNRKGVKVAWGEEQQEAFDKVKTANLEEIMLEYPNPNQQLDIYPDVSSTYMIGAVLVQDGKIMSTFLRKLNNSQLKYTVTGQELLAVVKTCKHFAQINRGCKI
jgi:hypothetical protein